MKRTVVLLVLVALGALGCDEADEAATPAGAVWLDDVEQPLPQWLSDTGLFADVHTFTPAEGVVPYFPPYPLWSSGADKARLLALPPGTTLSVGEDGGFVFPVGAVLAKTFTLEGIEGRRGEEVAVETRLMIKRAGGWRFAVYHWNRENTEAQLIAGERWPERVLQLEDPSGTGRTDTYTVPGALDCRACHETHRQAEPVIGLDPLNFDPDLAPVFDVAPAPVDLPAATPEEAAAMAYLLGNCVHCHHGREKGDNAAFSLMPAVLRANTVNQPTASSASGDGVRVVPGDPEGSAIYEAVVRARDPGYPGDFKPMPPVGIDRVDPDAAAVLRAWILSLEGG